MSYSGNQNVPFASVTPFCSKRGALRLADEFNVPLNTVLPPGTQNIALLSSVAGGTLVYSITYQSAINMPVTIVYQMPIPANTLCAVAFNDLPNTKLLPAGTVNTWQGITTSGSSFLSDDLLFQGN